MLILEMMQKVIFFMDKGFSELKVTDTKQLRQAKACLSYFSYRGLQLQKQNPHQVSHMRIQLTSCNWRKIN